MDVMKETISSTLCLIINILSLWTWPDSIFLEGRMYDVLIISAQNIFWCHSSNCKRDRLQTEKHSGIWHSLWHIANFWKAANGVLIKFRSMYIGESEMAVPVFWAYETSHDLEKTREHTVDYLEDIMSQCHILCLGYTSLYSWGKLFSPIGVLTASGILRRETC